MTLLDAFVLFLLQHEAEHGAYTYMMLHFLWPVAV